MGRGGRGRELGGGGGGSEGGGEGEGGRGGRRGGGRGEDGGEEGGAVEGHVGKASFKERVTGEKKGEGGRKGESGELKKRKTYEKVTPSLSKQRTNSCGKRKC